MISSAQLRQLASRGAPLSSTFDESARWDAAGAATWVEEITGHLAWVLAHPAGVPHRTHQSGRPLSFERVLAGFVDRAADDLVVDPDVLARGAVVQLERWLLERLAGLSAGVLDLEFTAYRAAHGTAFDHLVAHVLDPKSRSIRDDFEDGLLGGGLISWRSSTPRGPGW